MTPCHIPEYRSLEYEQAFNELWALACCGRVTVAQVRQEMSRLHRELVMAPAGAAVREQPDAMGVPHRLEPDAPSLAFAASAP